MNELSKHQQYLATASEVDPEEVRRALAAYRAHNGRRAAELALASIERLLVCDGCLGEQLRPGEDAGALRDQLREIYERLKMGS